MIYHDLLDIAPEDRAGAAPVELDALLAECDVLSIHVDGRAGNRGFVDARRLSLLKPDATVINTSRGFVVDNVALAEWLVAHPRGAALLDVHAPEPIAAGCPLLGLRNAYLYPHLAGRTRAGLEAMSWVVRDVVAVLEGRPPRWPAP